MKRFKLKQAKNILNQNLIRVMPMVEEITKRKLMPLCLIGFDANNKSKVIKVWFATISDDPQTEAALLEVSAQLLKSKKDAQRTESKRV